MKSRRLIAAVSAALFLPLPALADGAASPAPQGTASTAQASPAGGATTAAAPDASPATAATPAPVSNAQIDALQARLDDIQRQSAAQIDAIRGEIARLRGGPAPSGASQTAVVNPGSTANSGTANASSAAGASISAVSSANVVPPPAPNTQTTVKSAPTDQSVESIYQQQNALFTRRLTVTPSFTQTYSDNRFFTLDGFLALGAIFLGNVNVTQQRSNLTIFQTDVTYGLNDRTQLEVNVPYYSGSSLFTSVGANQSGESPAQDSSRYSGIGDVQLGAFYQVKRESLTSPSIVLNAHVSTPTGRSPYGIKLQTDASNNSLLYPSALPTGSGVFGYEIGASFVKTTDPAIFFGGLNYFVNGSNHFNDISTSPLQRQPGTAYPGAALTYQLGTAFALNEKTSLSFSFSDTITNDLRLRPDGGAPIQSIVGSGTSAAVLGIGTSSAISSKETVITQLGIGLTKDAPNFQFGIRIPRRF